MREKGALQKHIPEPAVNRAAQTSLDLRETWEWAALEERGDLVRIMILEVGVDVVAACVLWVKP